MELQIWISKKGAFENLPCVGFTQRNGNLTTRTATHFIRKGANLEIPQEVRGLRDFPLINCAVVAERAVAEHSGSTVSLTL